MKAKAKDPYVTLSWRTDERVFCRNYRESQLLDVMTYLRSHDVDVVYVNDEATTTTEWITTHYDGCALAKTIGGAS